MNFRPGCFGTSQIFTSLFAVFTIGSVDYLYAGWLFRYVSKLSVQWFTQHSFVRKHAYIGWLPSDVKKLYVHWLPMSSVSKLSTHWLATHRLVGLVVRRPPRERKIPGLNPDCAGIFSGSSHTSDFKIGTPVATLPGAWRYRVSTGTGRPGVSIL